MESSSEMTVTILDCSSLLQSEWGGLHRYWLELRYLMPRFIKLGPVALYRVPILFLAGSYVRLQLCCPDRSSFLAIHGDFEVLLDSTDFKTVIKSAPTSDRSLRSLHSVSFDGFSCVCCYGSLVTIL